MVKKPWAIVLCFKWHKCFVQERESLEDDERTGQPRMVGTELKIQEVAMLVCANRSQIVDEIAAAAGISHDTCHKILSDDLSMSCVTQHTCSTCPDARPT
jgi:hypothetical protein